MEIRVISSLTRDDEARYAAMFMKVIAATLENVALTYAIQVTHADGVLVHHGHGLPSAGHEDRPGPFAGR